MRIVSETPLPELERFEVPALLDVPDIEVTVSDRGFGGLRRRVSVTEADGHITCIEHLGRFGFAAKIDVETLSSIQVSKLLRRRRTSRTPTWSSPWSGGSWCAKATSSPTPPACRSTVTACLITARTDTGKTTTCLMSIKQQGSGLRVRRLAIIDPEGTGPVLPEAVDDLPPHMLHAVKGAADVGGGRAALQVQGRLHSKFGRSVGMAFGEHQPARGHDERARPDGRAAAEFHVDRLIPEAELVARSTSTGSW